MFKNITKKVLAITMGLSLAAAGLTPMAVLAKNNDDNHGQVRSAQVHLRNDLKKLDKENDDNKIDIKGSLGANVQAASNVFHQAMKQAVDNYQNAKAAAKAKLTAALNASGNMADRIAAWRTYLSDLLVAFQQYATAREATLAQFISAVGNPSVNQAPTANAQSVTLNENSSLAITLTGSDPEASSLTFSVVTSPAHGVLSGTAPNLTYTPSANFNGSDSFTFRVNDGSLNSISATVSITVNGVNQAPTANSQALSVHENSSLNITLTGSDPEASPLSYFVVTGTSHGTLSGTVPTLVYMPSTNFTGSDSFTFKVNDSSLDSATATVTINVTP